MTIRKYMILQDEEISVLQQQVNTSIENGWQPLGGIAYRQPVLPSENRHGIKQMFFQPMIKLHTEFFGGPK